MSKTIGVILTLKNKLSENMKPAISSMKEAERNIESLKQQLAQYDETIKAAKKEMETIETQIKEVSSTVLKNSEAYKVAKAEITNLKEANSQMENTIKSQLAILNQVSKEYGFNSNQYKEAKTNLQALKNQRKINIEAIKQQEEALEGLKESLLKNNPEIAELRKQEGQLKKSVEASEQSIKEKRKEVLNLGKSIKASSQEIEKSKATFKSWGASVIKSVDGALISIAKFGLKSAAAIAGATGLTFKNGLDTAINLEKSRVQLSTAVKDEKKTDDLMRFGNKFSIKTPFTPQEVISAIAMMETYKIDSKKWLGTVADASGAVSKELMQGVEAVKDALTKNEFEGLEEFGISKESLIALDKARNKNSRKRAFKKNGEVNDSKKLEALLQEVMESRFKGGSEKLANTISGVWSTLTGAISMGLAEILGMNNGLIQTGTVLDFIRTQVKDLGNRIVELQEAGKLKEIAEKVSQAFQEMLYIIKNTYNYLKNNGEQILAITKITLAVYGAIKIFILASQVITAYKVVMDTLGSIGTITTVITSIKNAVLALNVAMLANPAGAIVAAIMAAIVTLALLIKNFDVVKEKFHSWYLSMQDSSKPVVFLVEFLKQNVDMILNLFEGVAKVAGWLKGLFTDEEVTKEIELKKKITSENIDNNIPNNLMLRNEINNIPNEALNYNTMGLNFNNPNINTSSSICTGKSTLSPIETKQSNTFNITINGDLYGYEDFKEKVAEVIVAISRNMANVT